MKIRRLTPRNAVAPIPRMAVLGLALLGQVVAQSTTSPAPTDKPVELSPFVVNSSKDKGYLATNTLSGTRLNSENRYLGAATTEITPELLKDLAVNNFEDVLNYVPNSAPAQSGGLSSDPNGNEAIFGVRYRVRGFLLTGFSRDFFVTRVAPDSYNTDRMSFSRGPNAILFGIGEPGGITNAVSAIAGFNNTNEIGLRFDTWDSTRESAMFNRVIVKDKLAVKVAALHDDQRNFRNPWHNRANRYYGTLTYQPFKNTTLRVNHETGKTDRLNARAWAPSDGLTPWVNAGSRAVPANFLNVRQPSAAPTLAQQAALGMEVFRATPWQAMTLGAVANTTFYQNQYELRPAQRSVPGFTQGNISNISFTDDSVLPMTANVLGTGNKLQQHFNNTTITLDQKVAEGLYLQVAYNRQKTNELSDFSTGANDAVYVDLLPTVRSVNPTNPPALDGPIVSNPNYGKYFVYNDTPTMFLENYSDETARATLSYEFDFRKHFRNVWGKLLGRHSLAGLYEYYKTSFDNKNFQLRNAMHAASTQRYDLQSSWIGIQHYLDIPGGNFDLPDQSSLYPRIWQENAADIPGASPTGVSPMWLGTADTNTLTETRSKMFAMQDYFWENKIVTTFGWRNDDVDSWSIGSSTNPTTGLRTNAGLVDLKTGPRTSGGGHTYTRGVVVTPVPWIGVFYNESNNFHPANAGQVNIFGEPMPYEAGKGKDYGVKLYLLDGKITGTVDWFKTDYRNQSTRGPRTGPVASFDGPRVAMRNAIENYYAGLGTPALADIWNQPGYLNNDTYFTTQDYAAEGWEVSVTANPTPNWRLTLNVSKQRNVTSNVAADMIAWTKYIRTKLTDPALLGLTTTSLSNDGSHQLTVAENLNVVDQRAIEIASLNGFADQRQPELSANVVTAYDFTRGRLKNFGVGASYRWRGRAVVGYGLQSNGALDASQQYWNHATSWVGLFSSYRTKLFNKVRMRIQLNIDNALDADTPNVLLSRQVNGQRFDSRWALVQGRSFALSTNFEF